ncbi:unnamed protein product [Brugia pahangi]|uniref:Uncharacterized protein n=1 Tax=Brugia pahangi TaxID=6280 RepID=A0A0N4TSD5_BRUPA|nr:unnamed protein product [Brugia pahangi]
MITTGSNAEWDGSDSSDQPREGTLSWREGDCISSSPSQLSPWSLIAPVSSLSPSSHHRRQHHYLSSSIIIINHQQQQHNSSSYRLPYK